MKNENNIDSGVESVSSVSPKPSQYDKFPVRTSIRVVELASKRDYEQANKDRTALKPTKEESTPKKEKKDKPLNAFKLFVEDVLTTKAALILTDDVSNDFLCMKCNNYTLVQKQKMNLCDSCSASTTEDLCFACKQSNPEHHCQSSTHDCSHWYHKKCLLSWPQSVDSECPQEKCHSCFSRDCMRENQTLMKCVECPVAYHGDVFCLPAGSQILTRSQIICPRHESVKPKPLKLNIDWCVLCGEAGTILLCDFCCYSFHKECVKDTKHVDDEKMFKCEPCTTGILPLNYEVVWAKTGSYRWWPALIIPDNLVPENVMKLKRWDSQICVKYLGDAEYFWTYYDRVFLFSGEEIKKVRQGSKVDSSYNASLDEAMELYRVLLMQRKMLLGNTPTPYRHTEHNIPVRPVKIPASIEHVEKCKCTLENPCGFDCVNFLLGDECGVDCAMGESCKNQGIRRSMPAKTEIVPVMFGFGLKSIEFIKSENFVIEYVGDLINEAEMTRRMKKMEEESAKNFYFMTLSSNLYIDAGPSGNFSRFINHSCDPNCDSKKMSVDGVQHIGIYAIRDIEAVSILSTKIKASINYSIYFRDRN